MELLWGLLLLPCSLHVTFLEQPRTLFFPCIRPNNKERFLIFFMPSLQAPQKLIPQVFQPIILIPLIIRLPLNTAVHSGGVVFLSHNSDEGFRSTPCFSTPRYHVCVSVCAAFKISPHYFPWLSFSIFLFSGRECLSFSTHSTQQTVFCDYDANI
ncbi:hypothetical protein, conserved [Trypanosoma brucei brucei TREU927]|uniref:T. brucei spp.-specific protein n=1 Tax=Trypanosoma brucei brucei (strain 927/4 GUTat10.1) TaxID=185431 RepID=Q38CT4_TRYB2|nr:hypothetical protein, conserved [Trypanosoma brucei brucei TREU927]EAN77386.1 hypothetical protein, conserved [Trypanosoma brucei brucei TREU927]